eukprot:TRINITY_DN4523_c0_g4_i1.p2 TRINITY_DN4523_c0_g4~~TRINITY_DN4523_c0_g4_i1.p2  ORF type:complete len:263 (+),score=93.29 TRINITY_DN4523_c0_g4_i1:121-909(+)
MNDGLRDEIDALRAVFGEGACACTEAAGAVTVCIEVAPKTHLHVALPAGYPDCPAGAAASARMEPALKQEGTRQLNAYMAEEVACGDGAAVLYEAVAWVQEDLLPVVAVQAAPAPAPAEAAEGAVELHRQWIWFIGFYTKSIRKDFCEAAAALGCTGFLMPGKPAVAAVEGPPAAIAEFLRVTRTVLFAKVAPSARKMTLSLLDAPIAGRVFDGFEELDMVAAPSTHKRKDMADLGGLEAFLTRKGLGHAFQHIFNVALPDK